MLKLPPGSQTDRELHNQVRTGFARISVLHPAGARVKKDGVFAAGDSRSGLLVSVLAETGRGVVVGRRRPFGHPGR